jgi:hypothetical protein
MIRNESMAVSVGTGGYSAVPIAPDTDFELRWAVWRSRGVAHGRAVRRKLILVGGVAGALAVAVAIAYTLLYP